MPKRVNEGNLTSITTSSTTAMTESSDIYDSALEVSEEIECTVQIAALPINSYNALKEIYTLCEQGKLKGQTLNHFYR